MCSLHDPLVVSQQHRSGAIAARTSVGEQYTGHVCYNRQVNLSSGAIADRGLTWVVGPCDRESLGKL